MDQITAYTGDKNEHVAKLIERAVLPGLDRGDSRIYTGEEIFERLAKLVEQAVQKGLQAFGESQLTTRYLTTEEVSRMLHVSTRTIDLWRERGILPFVRFGRTVRFRLKDIDAHVESHLLVDSR